MNDSIISQLNSRDDTIAKLNSINYNFNNAHHLAKNDKDGNLVVQVIYGRVRWVDYSDPDYENDGHKVLEQEVTTLYTDGRVESKWVEVSTV